MQVQAPPPPVQFVPPTYHHPQQQQQLQQHHHPHAPLQHQPIYSPQQPLHDYNSRPGKSTRITIILLDFNLFKVHQWLIHNCQCGLHHNILKSRLMVT